MALLLQSSAATRLSIAWGNNSSSISSRRRRCGIVRCVQWDPENLFGAPRSGHIARRTLQKKMSQDAQESEAASKELQLQAERRRAARDARVVPEEDDRLIEFFLETEGQEMEFEIARCRLRLNEPFFEVLNTEIAAMRFKINRTEAIEDRQLELEALQKVLTEGIEAYDKLATDLVQAQERVTRILESRNKKATLLEMVASNELDRSVLVLLDQNIQSAGAAGQTQAAEFMKKVRGAVIKYVTI